MFVGVIASKPSRDFTRPLGMPRGFKRLVSYAKCNRFSHDNGLMFLVFNVFFIFVLLRD
jgi:hypothetical protein